MESIAAPLRALGEELKWFVRVREVRLLHVVATASLRPTAVKMIGAHEHDPANRSVFFVLEDAFAPSDAGWLARAERARALHDHRREAFQKEGHPLPKLPPRAAGLDPLGAFGVTLQDLEAARCPPIEGMVVVLAPSLVTSPESWCRVVAGLVNSRSLTNVRWIVVDTDSSTIDPLDRALGEAALRFECRADPQLEERELTRMMSLAASAPASAPGPAQAGAAWPQGVAPPRRKGQTEASPEQQAEIARTLGVHAALVGEGGAFVRRSALGAAVAMREKRGDDALRLQQELCNYCLQAGLVREGIIFEMILAGFLLQLQSRGPAVDTYRRAAARAEAAGLANEAAQAHLALGTCAYGQRDLVQAAAGFGRAAELARAAGLSLLAIEAYRMAGQVAADAGNPRAAAVEWNKALAVAQSSPPGEVRASSAAETARKLAALYRNNGMASHADALLAQAEAFEQPSIAEPTAAEAVPAGA